MGCLAGMADDSRQKRGKQRRIYHIDAACVPRQSGRRGVLARSADRYLMQQIETFMRHAVGVDVLAERQGRVPSTRLTAERSGAARGQCLHPSVAANTDSRAGGCGWITAVIRCSRCAVEENCQAGAGLRQRHHARPPCRRCHNARMPVGEK